MTPFFDHDGQRLYVGDARAVLANLPDESVHCCVTSPPYWGLRDYGTGSWEGGDPDHSHETKGARGGRGGSGTLDKRNANAMPSELAVDVCSCGARRIDRQLGLEPTPEEYVENMVAVFREVRRVLRNDGTCWLNVGDSYVHGPSPGYTDLSKSGLAGLTGESYVAKLRAGSGSTRATFAAGLKPKDLCGIPWMLAFALRADGWFLRSEIIWAKGISFCDSYSGSVMPESCRDRPTKAHEQVFLLTKAPSYFYDQDAIREEARWDKWGDQHQLKYEGTDSTTGWMQPKTREELQARRSPSWEERKAAGATRGNVAPEGNIGAGTQRGVHGDGLSHDLGDPMRGRNVRDVWAISPQGFGEAHFATFPPALIEPMIKAGTSEKGCCPECGSSWKRKVETVREPRNSGGHSPKRASINEGGVATSGLVNNTLPITRTTGWEPYCGCGDDQGQFHPVPCVTLDPFAGAGTVALVSRQLGRHSVGAELNPEYAEIAGKRLRIPDVVNQAAEKSGQPTQLVLGGEEAA